MLNLERKWFATTPWKTVETVNQELCSKDEQPHTPKQPGYDKAKALWEDAMNRNMKLVDALDIFRQVHLLAPFVFFNGNTVAALSKVLVAELLDSLPSVEAQMARSTVSHYVVGVIKRRELEDVFNHITVVWKKST